MEKLIELYEEYIELLSKEIDSMFSMARVHGYTSDCARINRGEELRSEIKKMKEKLNLVRVDENEKHF